MAYEADNEAHLQKGCAIIMSTILGVLLFGFIIGFVIDPQSYDQEEIVTIGGGLLAGNLFVWVCYKLNRFIVNSPIYRKYIDKDEIE